MNDKTVQRILAETEQTYDTIAHDFNQTRGYLWPGMSDYALLAKANDRILDLGCGNGKVRLLFKDLPVDYVGVDFSQALLDLALANKEFALPRQQFIKAPVYKLPFTDNSFDVIYFFAVFHHLPSEKLRSQTIREIERVLRPGGTLVMTNWNRYQPKTLKYILHSTFLKITRQSDLDFKDTYLPWMGGKAKRYYHAFTLGELKKYFAGRGLRLQKNYLVDYQGKALKNHQYFKAANLVSIAQKC